MTSKPKKKSPCKHAKLTPPKAIGKGPTCSDCGVAVPCPHPESAREGGAESDESLARCGWCGEELTAISPPLFGPG